MYVIYSYLESFTSYHIIVVECLCHAYISSYPPIFLEAPDKGGKNWGFLALESRFVGEYLEDRPS